MTPIEEIPTPDLAVPYAAPMSVLPIEKVASGKGVGGERREKQDD